MLEFLYTTAPTEQDASLVLPQTFQAPHLRHLVSCPITSPLLTPTTGLVTASLLEIRSSANLRPHDLLQRLTLMPQPETLGIDFPSPIPSRDIERQLRRTPPNLRWFGFRGVSAYLGALLPRITAQRISGSAASGSHSMKGAFPRGRILTRVPRCMPYKLHSILGSE
jgi:hypothetical protein